jgi:hypothetical protein
MSQALSTILSSSRAYLMNLNLVIAFRLAIQQVEDRLITLHLHSKIFLGDSLLSQFEAPLLGSEQPS